MKIFRWGSYITKYSLHSFLNIHFSLFNSYSLCTYKKLIHYIKIKGTVLSYNKMATANFIYNILRLFKWVFLLNTIISFTLLRTGWRVWSCNFVPRLWWSWRLYISLVLSWSCLWWVYGSWPFFSPWTKSTGPPESYHTCNILHLQWYVGIYPPLQNAYNSVAQSTGFASYKIIIIWSLFSVLDPPTRQFSSA
jgi:hypothetical protein